MTDVREPGAPEGVFDYERDAAPPGAAAHEEPWGQLETIDAPYARELLATNVRNRRVSKYFLSYLKGILQRGEWVINGDTIRISREMKLLDGQHRLRAVAETGIPIRTFVIYGLDPAAQLAMDQGKKRTNADQLDLYDEPDTSTLASALSWYQRYEENHMVDTGPHSKQTPHQAVALLDANPDMRASLRWGNLANRSGLGLPPGVSAAVHYILAQKDREEADEFFYRLSEGVNVPPNSPLYILRRTFLRNAQRTAAEGRLPRTHIAAYIIKAWNAQRRNQEIKLLKYLGSENFPRAI